MLFSSNKVLLLALSLLDSSSNAQRTQLTDVQMTNYLQSDHAGLAQINAPCVPIPLMLFVRGIKFLPESGSSASLVRIPRGTLL